MFQERIVLSILSGKEIILNQQLLRYERRWMEFVLKITKGSVLEEKEKEWLFKPGFIEGKILVLDCGHERGIGYFLEWFLVLGLFGDGVSEWIFHGITNNSNDVSVDSLRTVYVKLIKMFKPDVVIEMKIRKRGFCPDGGGEVLVRIIPIQRLPSIEMTKEGKVDRIRGLSTTGKISSQFNNRIIDAVREILTVFVSDVYIHTDVFKGNDAGLSPGYGICLVAEATDGGVCYAEGAGVPRECPEELVTRICKDLLKEIYHGGIVGRRLQKIFCLLMAISSIRICRARIGILTKETKVFICEIQYWLGVVFERQLTDKKIIICSGSGLQNYSFKLE